MLEYLLEENDEDIKFDPGIDDADDFKSFDYERIANGFDTAIEYGRYDMCKYYIDHGIKPNNALTSYPAIKLAINCEDYELFRLVYDYIKEEYGAPDEEVFGWCFSTRNLTDMLPYASSDMIEMVLDSGTEMEYDILKNSYYASKATVKLLMEIGANLKPTADEDKKEYGIEYCNLKNLYERYCHDDLVELLEEYE